MELRDYQRQAKNDVYRAWKAGNRRVMLQVPTGGGKTIIFTSIAKDFIKRPDAREVVWTLVHRKELIEQSVEKSLAMNIYTSVIQADYAFKADAQYQVASVPTLVKRLDRYKEFQPFHPTLIICDEAHHSPANSYKAIYEAFPNARILGVTATPVRTNGEGFTDLFDTIVHGPTMKELIEQGYLVAPRVIANPLPFDLKRIKVTAGDYNEKALYDAFNEKCTYGDLVSTWRQYAEGKRTIVFAINVEHSQHIVEEYNRAGISAEHIDGTTAPELRKAALDRFRKGETLVISNFGIITEGFDVPTCECIQLTRSTKALWLYLQMVGRGLRSAKGKEQGIILDHANSILQHGFPQEDRIWTLKGIQKKVGIKEIYRDKKTGEEYEKASNIPEHVSDLELIEIEYDEVRMTALEKFIKVAKDRKYKPGYAWFQFLKKYPKPTEYEIRKFQMIANYNPKWINYQLKEFGYD